MELFILITMVIIISVLVGIQLTADTNTKQAKMVAFVGGFFAIPLIMAGAFAIAICGQGWTGLTVLGAITLHTLACLGYIAIITHLTERVDN